jgi:hypothetical protein
MTGDLPGPYSEAENRMQQLSGVCNITYIYSISKKAVPLHAMEALEGEEV